MKAVARCKRPNRWDFESFRVRPTVRIQDYRVIGFCVSQTKKKRLKGVMFDCDEEIKAEVKRWFAARDEQYYIWTALQNSLNVGLANNIT